MKIQLTGKTRLEIDKDQSTMILVIAIAAIVSVFCLVSAKALLSQAAYQRRVVNARHAAASQLEANIQNANTLSNQYTNVFEGTSATNVIGGKNTTAASAQPPDGDNGRIVLDALPTTYDFPALLTSMSKLLANDNIGAPSIGGTDDSSSVSSSPSSNPQPVSISLSISGSGSYSDVQNLFKDMERSIRPFDITKLTLSGNESTMSFSVEVTTYYQPAKTLNTTAKEIR